MTPEYLKQMLLSVRYRADRPIITAEDGSHHLLLCIIQSSTGLYYVLDICGAGTTCSGYVMREHTYEPFTIDVSDYVDTEYATMTIIHSPQVLRMVPPPRGFRHGVR